MKNYPDDDGLAIAGRLALFFTLIFSYPVLMNPCRDAINSLCLLLLRNCTRSRFFAVREEVEVPETTNEIHVCVCVRACVRACVCISACLTSIHLPTKLACCTKIKIRTPQEITVTLTTQQCY